MFEQSEFINFPDLSAFYGTLGGKSFGTFLFAEKYKTYFLPSEKEQDVFETLLFT